MLADFYIPRRSNDMKIAVQKNNLGVQIWYRSLDPVKKRRQTILNSASHRSTERDDKDVTKSNRSMPLLDMLSTCNDCNALNDSGSKCIFSPRNSF